MSYAEDQNINDSSNKIIIIYNHGQADHDEPSNNCVWKNGIRNFSSLVGEKVKGKEIMVYLFCTGKLAGDDKRLWNKKKFKPPYKGGIIPLWLCNLYILYYKSKRTCGSSICSICNITVNSSFS